MCDRLASTRGFASILMLVVLSTLAVCAPVLALATTDQPTVAAASDTDSAFLAAHQPEGAPLGGADAIGFVIGLLVIAALVLVILILAKEI